MKIDQLIFSLGKSIRPVSSGRMLITHWDESDAVNTAESALRLGQNLVITAPKQSQSQNELNGVVGEFLSEIEASHNQFSVALVPGHLVENYHKTGDKRSVQSEMQHAKKATKYLATGGLLLLVARRERISFFQSWIQGLMKLYRNLQAFKINDELALIAGFRADGILAASRTDYVEFHRKIKMGEIPSLPDRPFLSPPSVAPDDHLFIRSMLFDPETIEQAVAKLPWDENKVMNDVTGWSRPAITPAFRLRPKHLASLISSGVMGTLSVISPNTGDACIIRGVTSRELFEGDEAKEGEERRLVKKSTVKTSILLLNINKHTLTTIDPQDGLQVRSFLEEWGRVLMDEVERTFEMVYDPINAPYSKTFHSYLTKMINRSLSRTAKNLTGEEHPTLTIPQRHTVAMALRILLGRYALDGNRGDPNDTGRKAFFLQGEKGVGKSIMSARILEGLVLEYKNRKGLRLGFPGWPVTAIVTVPANLEEFVKEVKKASALLDPVIVKNIADLQKTLRRARVSPKPIVMLIPRTMLSQSQRLTPAYQQGALKYHYVNEKAYDRMVCPGCGAVVSHQLVERYGREDDLFIKPADLIKGSLKIRGHKCFSCDTPLWQETHRGGYQMAAVAKKLFRKARVKPLAIFFDEVHEDRGENSTRGQAMAWFADMFDKCIGGTGTLYGGVSSSLFHLFYRMIPEFRKAWEVDGVGDFIRRYGNWKRYFNDETDRWSNLIEVAGISPLLMAGFIINYSVFLTLKDVGLPMPDRDDFPALVSMTDLEQKGFDALINDVKANLQTEGKSSEKRLSRVTGKDAVRMTTFSVGLHLPLHAEFSPAYKCPECGESQEPIGTCQHKWTFDPALLHEQPDHLTPVLDPDFVSSKEQNLIEIVRREAKEGRACLIYVWNTGPDYRIDKRLENILANAGLRGLNVNKVPSNKIQKRINMASYEGFDAILVNPMRVGTGTNLIGTPTVIFYQPFWRVYIANQAASRPLRPTQTRDVRIFWSTAVGSPEEVILAKIIDKMVSMEFVAGGDIEGMSAVMEAVGHEESFEEALYKYLMGERKNDLSELFEALNETQLKDRENDPQMQTIELPKVREILSPFEGIDLSKAEQLSMFSAFDE